jgi:hypothetical protein
MGGIAAMEIVDNLWSEKTKVGVPKPLIFPEE